MQGNPKLSTLSSRCSYSLQNKYGFVATTCGIPADKAAAKKAAAKNYQQIAMVLRRHHRVEAVRRLNAKTVL